MSKLTLKSKFNCELPDCIGVVAAGVFRKRRRLICSHCGAVYNTKGEIEPSYEPSEFWKTLRMVMKEKKKRKSIDKSS